MKVEQGHWLIRLGIILFLFGLLTGFIIPLMSNPRMGLSSHLEAILNGMFLMILGLIWPRLYLSDRLLILGFGLSVYASFVNWLTTFLAAVWGAGAIMMPIAGQQMQGKSWQELLIQFGLISLSLSVVTACGIVLWGLRKYSS